MSKGKPVLTWGDWYAADRSRPYPREELVDYDVLVDLIRESGVLVCGNCHQHAKDSAPFVDGIGVAVSMRVWGGIMHDVERPDNDTSIMGYCDWAWGNDKCRSCGKQEPK